MTVESPCIQVCTLDGNGICLGCYRTADEIRDWISSNDEERERILLNISKEWSNKCQAKMS